MTVAAPASRVLAVVPAKSRSRRAPGKNLAELAGRPLFAHSVRVALAAGMGNVIVTSDAPAILAAAVQAGARAIVRPDALCTDEATNFQVLCWLLEHLATQGETYDVVALLQPTTPFRTPGPLADCAARFASDPTADSLVTVTRVTRPEGTVDGARWHSALAGQTRLKQVAPRHALTGHLFLFRPERTLARGTLLGDAIVPVDLPAAWLDVDIDTGNDLLLAQAVAAPFFEARFP